MKMNKILYKKHCLFIFTYFTLGKKILKKNHQYAQCDSLSTLTFQKNNSLAFISFIVSYLFYNVLLQIKDP